MANYWASLPPTIIGFILSHVAQEAASGHTLARYATVNKDWQYLFEQLSFRKLSLGPDDLADFEMTVSIHSGRRKWLQAVSFHDHADGGRSNRQMVEHNPSQTVLSLLTLLKKWDHDANLRVALYLSARTTSSLDTRRTATFHDSALCLHPTNQPRLFETDFPGHMSGGIPAVSSFAIQYRGKEVTSTQTAISLCSLFPGLEEFCLQNLDHPNEHTKLIRIAELTSKLPTTLKRLHVIGQGSKAGHSASASRFLVQHLVLFGVTMQLKELSITTSGNAAEDFFDNFGYLTPGSAPTSGNLHWPALECLTLACSLLRPRISRPVVNRFLHQVGIAALGLPRLRQLRLLSYSSRRPGEVDGFFRYAIGSQREAIASCPMSSTGIIVSKHIRMGRLVMDTWRGVAWRNHRVVLRFSSDVCHQSSLVTDERLVDEHGRSEFRDIKYPRPHWTANEDVRDLLGAVIFFVVLVVFLSFLVRQVAFKEQVIGKGFVSDGADDDVALLPWGTQCWSGSSGKPEEQMWFV